MLRKKKIEDAPIGKVPVEEVPLYLREDLIFEKLCPSCNILNYTSEVEDRGKGWASIWFTCKKCRHRYRNWWYGTSPAHGSQPLWHEILRKPFEVICIREDKGVTVECIYEAFESTEDNNAFIIVDNDNGHKGVEYPKEYFIADMKKKR